MALSRRALAVLGATMLAMMLPTPASACFQCVYGCTWWEYGYGRCVQNEDGTLCIASGECTIITFSQDFSAAPGMELKSLQSTFSQGATSMVAGMLLKQSTGPSTYTCVEGPASTQAGFVLDADRGEIHAMVEAAPRLAEALWGTITVTQKTGMFGGSGEYMTSRSFAGNEALHAAIAQDSMLKPPNDLFKLRLTRSAYWSGDSSLLLLVKADDGPASGNVLEARFERVVEPRDVEGKALPLYRLAAWKVEEKSPMRIHPEDAGVSLVAPRNGGTLSAVPRTLTQ